MWANAQRDGRPAEHRWRPLFNAAVWLAPNTGVPCSNAAKTRKPLKFAGVPNSPTGLSRYCAEVPNIVGTCGGDFCCLTIFPIVNTCLSCEDIARQICAMVPKCCILAVFGSCISSELHAAHFRPALKIRTSFRVV